MLNFRHSEHFGTTSSLTVLYGQLLQGLFTVYLEARIELSGAQMTYPDC
jgi:hypothetical protein